MCSHQVSKVCIPERVDFATAAIVGIEDRRSYGPIGVLVGNDVIFDTELFLVFVFCVGCEVRFIVDDLDTVRRDVEQVDDTAVRLFYSLEEFSGSGL